MQAELQGLSRAAIEGSSLPPATRILKVYTEALTGFSPIHSPDGPNTLLSQGCALENGSHCGKV